MAVVLLDSIINETIKNFRGHQLLENSLGLQEGPSASLATSSNASLALNPFVSGHQTESASHLDQLDSLTSLMQEIEIGRNERIFWILLFLVMVLVAAGGNVVVIYIVSTNKEMKSVTNYFLVNLSLADTMVSTLNVIFNFISMLNSHWPFGKIYCKISNFIAILSISASVFTLTAISCDRYNAIIYPLRPRMSRRHAIAWILLIWTLSSALALPNLIYSVVVEDRLVNENLALTCTMIWPDGRYPLSSYDHIYNIIILVVTYLVPILTMAILYYEVGKELWGYEAIGENIEKQRRAIMAKKKDGPLLYQRCYLIIYWLAMSNSMYNPIIIYFMNSKFRHEFRRVLWLICCCRTYVPPIKTESMTSNNQSNNINISNYNTIATSHHNNSLQNSGAVVSRLLGLAARDQPEKDETTTTTSNTTTSTTPISRRCNNPTPRSAKNNGHPAQQMTFGTLNKSTTLALSDNIMPIEVIITQSSDHDALDSMAEERQLARTGQPLADEANQERMPFLDHETSERANESNFKEKISIAAKAIDLIPASTSCDKSSSPVTTIERVDKGPTKVWI